MANAASLDEARRHARARAFLVGLVLVDGACHDEHACQELGRFLHEHWRVQWVAVLSRQALQRPCCRQWVRDHCCDFHTWPVDARLLRHTLGHLHGLALLAGGDMAEVAGPGAIAGPGRLAAPSLTGHSGAIARLRRQIVKVASASAPVLIWGESGSGKELAAQEVHAHSARRAGPFVPINCGAMPASLIHSELFGYERGAFTGATREKRGLIESAGGGSIFLDEIGDLPLELQANLLRFLQEKTIYRLGSTHSIAVDARVIAASHVNLQRAVERGAFREDLYYRLNVLALDVPPLRERIEDLAALAEHFFHAYASERAPRLRGFSSKAVQAIREHHWPGNVRELINRVRRAMVMAEGRLILPHDLGLELDAGRAGRRPAEGPAAATGEGADLPGGAADGAPLDHARIRAERHAIDASLVRAGKNITLAARELGVSRMTLYRLLAKHGIRAPARASGTAQSHS